MARLMHIHALLIRFSDERTNMKRLAKQVWFTSGIVAVTLLMTLGMRTAANRTTSGIQEDRTFFYEAAALFDNQNYVAW